MCVTLQVEQVPPRLETKWKPKWQYCHPVCDARHKLPVMQATEVIPKKLWIAQVVHALTVAPSGVVHALTVAVSRINGRASI